jgi:hypothetical protein
VEPKNRLKPFLDSLNAFTEAKREMVGTIVSWFEWMKVEHQKKIRKPHVDRLAELLHEANVKREDEINEALRTGDDEALKRIRADMIRLVLDQKP